MTDPIETRLQAMDEKLDRLATQTSDTGSHGRSFTVLMFGLGVLFAFCGGLLLFIGSDIRERVGQVEQATNSPEHGNAALLGAIRSLPDKIEISGLTLKDEMGRQLASYGALLGRLETTLKEQQTSVASLLGNESEKLDDYIEASREEIEDINGTVTSLSAGSAAIGATLADVSQELVSLSERQSAYEPQVESITVTLQQLRDSFDARTVSLANLRESMNESRDANAALYAEFAALKTDDSLIEMNCDTAALSSALPLTDVRFLGENPVLVGNKNRLATAGNIDHVSLSYACSRNYVILSSTANLGANSVAMTAIDALVEQMQAKRLIRDVSQYFTAAPSQ